MTSFGSSEHLHTLLLHHFIRLINSLFNLIFIIVLAAFIVILYFIANFNFTFINLNDENLLVVIIKFLFFRDIDPQLKINQYYQFINDKQTMVKDEIIMLRFTWESFI